MKSLFFGTAITLLMASSAYASDVTLCAGKEGGGYDSVIRAIGTELQKQGNNVTILNLDGSEAILNSLEDGKCSYGPSQKDVHYMLSRTDVGLETQVRPASILYPEVMTMACSKESGIDELSDLDENSKVIVDTIGSGSALTWENMVKIEKEYGGGSSWSQATPVYVALDDAEAAISVGEAQCAFGVAGVPAKWAKRMESNGFTLAWIYDKDLNDLQYPKGTSLYNALRVYPGAYSSKFDTYKVPAVLFRSAKIKNDPAVDKIVTRMAPSIGKRYDTINQ